ncbi:uncharacterized protein ACNS7B_014301 [Menidia menidia]
MSFKAVFLLCLGLSAAAGEQKELSGVVGGNITLPDSILDKGFLYHNGSHIASLIKGTFDTRAKKVHWKNENGLFTITDLQRNDSGVYKLESNMGSVFNFSYWLRVFDPVPTPEVSRLNTNVTTPGDLNQTESGIKETKRHHYWIMPPVFLVAVVLLYILFKCCKKKMTNGQTQTVSVGSNSKFRSLTRVRLETVLLGLKRWSSEDAGPAWETKLPQLTSQDSLLTSVVTK